MRTQQIQATAKPKIKVSKSRINQFKNDPQSFCCYLLSECDPKTLLNMHDEGVMSISNLYKWAKFDVTFPRFRSVEKVLAYFGYEIKIVSVRQ